MDLQQLVPDHLLLGLADLFQVGGDQQLRRPGPIPACVQSLESKRRKRQQPKADRGEHVGEDGPQRKPIDVLKWQAPREQRNQDGRLERERQPRDAADRRELAYQRLATAFFAVEMRLGAGYEQRPGDGYRATRRMSPGSGSHQRSGSSEASIATGTS